MQIRVKCNCGDGKCSEWAIVELQGVVESQLAISDQINGLEIGHLCCSSSSSSSQPSYILTVGYHELSGTKVQLKKPLLVLQKRLQQMLQGLNFLLPLPLNWKSSESFARKSCSRLDPKR